MARPIPVFPLVASTTVWPGLRSPDLSAASITPRAKRSFTEPSGLKASIFTKKFTPCGAKRLIRTTGVLPTVSTMLWYFPAHLPLLKIVCDELRVDFGIETTQVLLVTLSGFACGLTSSGFQKRFIEQCSITSLRWRARYPLCAKNRQAAGACFWTPG